MSVVMKKFALCAVFSTLVALGGNAAVVAYDDYESTGLISYGYNGGFGYGPLTHISGVNGGVIGVNVGLNGRQIDGLSSLGVFSAGNTHVAGRAISSPVTQGIFNLDARWDITNGAGNNPFTGINLASSLGTSFGANELLSFGLIGGVSNAFQS